MSIIREQLVESRSKTWDGTSACTSITIHETANTRIGAGAQAHANLQSKGNVRQASWHIQVDDREAIRSFPDEVQCWHAGWSARDSISIEICVNQDSDYDQALVNAAAVVAELREKHGLGRDALRMHYDWSGKNCPSRMRSTLVWKDFIASTDPDLALPKPPTVGDNGQGAAGLGGGRSVRSMALEIIAGLHGNGHETRRRSLGISPPLYMQVRTEVNRLAAGTPKPTIPKGKSVSQMAAEVIDGKHGQGHEHRRRSLGITAHVYEQVRSEVNRRLGSSKTVRATKSVSQMATEVLAGLHGNGHNNRRRSLGITEHTYSQVRAEVNRRA